MGALIVASGFVSVTCRMDNVVAPPVSGVLVPSSSSVADSAPVASTALRVSKVALGTSQPGSLSWRAERARNSAWLALPRTTGTAPDTLEIRIDPAGLAPGLYRDTVVLSTNNYEAPPLRVPVEFMVHPCRVTPVPLDTVLNAPLSGADCGAPRSPGAFARVFSFPGVAGDSITLELVATGFNATMVLDTVPAPGTALPLARVTGCRGVVGDPCIPYIRLPITGNYFVEVSGSTPAPGGTFVLHVKAPKPPAAPDQPRQLLADTLTAIATGATVAAQPVVFTATLQDPDVVDTLRLEMELRSTAAAFTGTPTHTSALVANGSRATIVTTVPDDSSYHWRVRTVDQTGRRSAWFAYGGNAETTADFTVTVPQTPAAPAALAQLRATDLTPIAVGGSTGIPDITFRAAVSDPDPGDQLRLEIELRPVGTAFTNTPTHQGQPVGNGGTAEVAVLGLTDNTAYYWQARVVDQTSRASAWTAYGGNPAANADFDVAVPATQLVFSVQPTTTTAAQAISPAMRVTALDADGNTAVSFADTIELALGAPAGGATLSGTIKVKAVLGVAIFVNAHVDRTGAGYTLIASSQRLPGVTATSTAFNILAGPPAQIAYTVQPSTVTSAAAIAPAVQVVVQDAGGNTATGYNGTLAAAIGSNPSGGALSGTLLATAVAGHATLPNLRIDKAGAGYTLIVSGAGLTSATSVPFSVTPAAAAVLVFTDQPVLGDAGLPLVPAAQVTARDAQGNVATGYTGDVTLEIGTNPGAGTLSGTSTRAAVAGVATFPGLSIDMVGTGYTLVASAAGGITPDTSAAFTIRAATGARLVFRIHPSDALAGAPLGSPVQVGVQDAFGNLATTFSGSVTMALEVNPASGTLGGTVTVPVVAGLANFTDLSVDKVGAGYTLSASATGLDGDTSAAFTITHAAPHHLAFTVQPTAGHAGVAITPAVQVIARDAFDNTATSFTGNIDVAIGTNPGGGTLSGTTQVAAIAGLATFPGLSIERVGAGYTLTAAATGLIGATSTPFNVATISVTQLAFTVQPTNAIAATAINPAVQVTARDGFGNTSTGFTGNVTIAIGTNPNGGTLTGTLTRAAVAGVATFPGLSVDKAGTGYTLTAVATGLSGATSTAFNITHGVATKLAFVVPPSDDAAGSFITPAIQVAAHDAHDNLVPTFTGTVTVALGANPGASTLSGTTAVAAVSGIATFGTLSINRTSPGYTLTAATTGLTGATSAPFEIFAAPATSLVFTAQPGNVTAGATFTTVRVTARDAQGNTATGFTGNVTVALAANPAGGALTGTTTVQAVAGVAAFTALSLDRVGAGYTLSASANLAGTAVSGPINVVAGPAAQLFVTVAPGTTIAGQPLAPAIEVVARDAGGNTATSFEGTVTLTIGANPAEGTLAGSFTRVAANGVVNFPNVNIDRVGVGYTLIASSAGVVSGTSAAFDIVPGPPTRLLFTVQPTNTAAASSITPAIQVTARDSEGNLATSFTGDVTLGFERNPGGSSLVGGGPIAAIGGVATFPDVRLNKAGVNYQFNATAGGLSSTTSGFFTVTAGPAAALAFTVQPSDAIAGNAISPAVRVTALDADGNLATQFTGDVTIAIGTNPGSGTLSGTLTAAAVLGVAIFNDLRINAVGQNYRLAASAPGLTTGTSIPFNIVLGPAAQLAFTVQPTEHQAGVPIGPTVRVDVQDSQGNRAFPFVGTVTLTLTNPDGAILTGGGPVTVNDGIAVFPALRVNKVGTGYILQASSAGLTGTVSAPFTIIPGDPSILEFAVQPPAATVAATAMTPAVEVLARDASGNIATGFTGIVTIGLAANPGGGTVGGATAVAATAGRAIFPALSINKTGNGYALSASASGLTGAASAPFSITPGLPTQLVFTVQPKSAVSAVAIAPAVRVTALDAQGNTATNFNGDVTVTIGTNPAAGVLSGSATVSALAGVATFSDLEIDLAGEGYTLIAAATGLAGATSAAFDITPAPASVLVYTVQPSDATAGVANSPPVVITARDAQGNTATGFNGSVALSLVANPGGATLSGAIVNAVAGVATFTNLRVNRSGVGYTLAASAGGITGVASDAFTVIPAPASALVFTVQPTTTVAGIAIAPALQVTARDSLGNTATSFTGNVTIAIGTNPGAGTLSGTLTAAATSGVATFNNVRINRTGTGYTVVAAAAGAASGTSGLFNITPAPGHTLVFTVPPVNTTAGFAITPAVQVTARDSLGNTATGFTGNVTVAIGTNPGGGTLSGGPVAAVAGVATFPGLSINAAGTGYTLTASAGGVFSATSPAFNIVSGVASQLVFTVQPSNATAGVANAPAVQVTARDANGNTATGFTGNVTITIGANPGSGTLSGALDVNAVAGVATFSNLRVNRTGTGYTLVATSGPMNTTSGAFNIAHAPASVLVITNQPTNTTAGVAIAPAVQVTARDSVGNVATGFTSLITMAIGTNPGTSTLTGTPAVAAVAGVATFANLRLNRTGNGYTLTAAATGLSGATSSAFNIAPAPASALVVTVQPTATTAGVAIAPPVVITAQDSVGNTATSFAGNVTMAIGANPGTSTLTGAPVAAAVAGVATFPNLRLNRPGTGYTLAATAGGLTGTTTAAFNVVAAPASALVFTIQPVTTTAGVAIAPAVQVTARDSLGNTANSFNGNVTIAIGANPGGSTLVGAPVIAAVAGVATFTNLRLNRTGTGYTLLAGATGVTGATSSAFNITHAPATALVYTVQPNNATAGAAISPEVVVTARDSVGNTATSFTGNVTIALGANPGGSTLTGAPVVAAVAGVATFPNLRLNRTGTGYTLNASSGGLTGGTSAAFNIVPAPASVLVFTSQPPPTTVAGVTLAPAIEVTARDSVGNTATGFAGSVTMVLGANPGGATLGGTTTLLASGGVVSFGSLSVNRTGTGYTLVASATGVTSGTSSAFNITPGVATNVAFSVQPTTAVAATNIAPAIRVTARDANGNTATSFTGNISLAIETNPGGSTLTGGAPVAAVAGVATFPAVSLNKTGFNYTLSAASPGLASGTSTVFNITPGAPFELTFTGQPTDAIAGNVISPPVRVTAFDVQGNVATQFTGNVTVGISANPGGGTLSGTLTAAAAAGVAIFNDLRINAVGLNYRLGATTTGLAGATSIPFNINVGSATQLAFSVQPTQQAINQPITPAVRVDVLDGQGNKVFPFVGAVTLTLTNPNGAVLTGGGPVSVSDGVATFAGLRVDRVAAGYILQATSAGLTSVLSTAFNIIPGSASVLEFAVQPPASTVAATAMTPAIEVLARDASGNIAIGFTGTVTIGLAANPGGGIVAGNTAVAATAGRAVFPGLSINKTGNGYALSASASGISGGTSNAFSITPGVPTQLAFTVLPSSSVAGVAMTPAVRVTALDAQGNTATNFNGNITVAIGTNPAGGVLSGGGSVAAVAGVATYSALSINTVGTGYTLTAASAGLVGTTSPAFDIAAGPASVLVYTVQPSSATAGVAFSSAIVVTARDAQGNTASGFGGNVTLAIGTNPGGGTLSGTPTVAAVAGVATFPGLSINRAGNGYTLSASAGGVAGGTSSAFNITPGTATQLAFSAQPPNTTAGVVMSPAVVVTAQDTHGNTATGFNGNITVAIGTNPGAGTLSGTLTVAAVAGNATFSTLRINRTGNGYTLGATAAALTGATSAPFNISPAAASILVFTAQPTNATAGAAITPAVQVTALDNQGNVATSYVSPITLAFGANPGGGILSGGGPVAAVAGVASFPALSVNATGNGYTVIASGTGVTGATSTAFNIGSGLASQLVFTVQPSNATAGVANAPAVQVTARDALGNTATAFSGNVTIGIGTNPGGSTLTGGGPVAAVNGVATFTNLRLNRTGTGYTLLAAAAGLTSATSGSFNIAHAPASVLVITNQPTNATAGVAIAPAVQVTARDSVGNTATSFNSNVTIAIGTNPGASTLTGGGPLAAVNGVATFANLRLNRTGTGYTLTAAAAGLTGATSATLNIAPAPASALFVTVQPTTTTAGVAISPAVQVTARDSVGNTATTFNGNVTIAIGANPGASVLSGVPTVAAVAGIANFTNLRLDRPGTGYTLMAASAGVIGTTTSAFNIVSAPASVLVWTVQPTNVTAGVAVAPAPQLTARDSLGNTVTSFTGNVTIAIGANPGSSTLVGAPVVAAVAGVATFPNLRLNRTGTGYTLIASATGTNSPTSAAFNVVPAPASVLAFTTQPGTTTAGIAIAPAVQVTARDSVGNTATTFNGNVTIAIGANPGASTLTGNPVIAAASGVATFPNLRLNRTGTGYTLNASSGGLTGATSAAFNIVPAPASVLVFTTQPPPTAVAGATLTPDIQVTARDSVGNTATSFTGSVTMALGANPGGATLGGTTTLLASAGVVSFGSLNVNRTGNGYTLVASATGVTSGTSTAFNITPGTASVLVFTVQPTTAVAATNIAPAISVTARDNQGNTATSFTGNVALAIQANPGGSTLTGGGAVAAVAGVATFPAVSLNKTGFNYTLSAAASGLVSGTSAVFNITPGTPFELAFTGQPTDAIAGVVISPVVRVTALDAQGNIATQFTGNVTMAIGTNPGASTLSGTTVRAAVAGVATFDNLSLNAAAQNYRLSATASGLTTATSFQFNINAGPAAQLAFEVQPSDAAVDVAITPTVRVRVEDAQGNVIFGYVGTVTLTLTNPNGAILSSGGPVAVTDGRASFPALRVNQAGTYNVQAASGGLSNAVSTAFTITGAASLQ